jgi:hypothetical protein
MTGIGLPASARGTVNSDKPAAKGGTIFGLNTAAMIDAISISIMAIIAMRVKGSTI